MADIFISYAREDETRIRELVRALEGEGWSIFWDRRIPSGKTWQSYIGQALSDAKCVIVAWSTHSITSDWVIEEANDAKERGILVPILLDSVKPPLGFRGIQAADLTDWKLGDSSPHFDQLIQDIAGVVKGKSHQTPPEKELTQRTQPVATPRAVPTEPPPHELAPLKPKPLKGQLEVPALIKSPGRSKKRIYFLIGAMIVLALTIAAGSAVWFFPDPPRKPETEPVEPVVESLVEPQLAKVEKYIVVIGQYWTDQAVWRAYIEMSRKKLNAEKYAPKNLQVLTIPGSNSYYLSYSNHASENEAIKVYKLLVLEDPDLTPRIIKLK